MPCFFFKKKLLSKFYEYRFCTLRIFIFMLFSSKKSKFKRLPTNENPETHSGLTLARLLLISIGQLGTTFIFSIQFALLVPYVLALGLSRTMTSLTWICGPFTGIVRYPSSIRVLSGIS